MFLVFLWGVLNGISCFSFRGEHKKTKVTKNEAYIFSRSLFFVVCVFLFCSEVWLLYMGGGRTQRGIRHANGKYVCSFACFLGVSSNLHCMSLVFAYFLLFIIVAGFLCLSYVFLSLPLFFMVFPDLSLSCFCFFLFCLMLLVCFSCVSMVSPVLSKLPPRGKRKNVPQPKRKACLLACSYRGEHKEKY